MSATDSIKLIGFPVAVSAEKIPTPRSSSSSLSVFSISKLCWLTKHTPSLEIDFKVSLIVTNIRRFDKVRAALVF